MIEKSVEPISSSVNNLFSEIRQIHDQYKKEVPKQRRPWPTSIQARILELWKLGVSTHEISAATGLPAQTMYSWRERIKKKDPGFLPVPIVKRRRRSKSEVQLSQLDNRENKSTTVTVVTSDGLRIEGIPVDQVAEIVRRIGAK